MTAPLLTEKQLSERTGIPVSTLQKWRHQYAWKHEGPRWLKLGRAVRYDPRDVEAWLAESRVA